MAKTKERELAQEMYVRLGYTQRDIAEKVKASTQSVNTWAREDEWDKKRSAFLTGPAQIAANLQSQLLIVSEFNAKAAKEGKFDSTMADAQLKLAKAIEALSEKLPMHIQLQVLDQFIDHIPTTEKGLRSTVAGFMTSYLTKLAQAS